MQKWKSRVILAALAVIGWTGVAEAGEKCGGAYLGGPPTMPLIVQTHTIWEPGLVRRCEAQASWYTFWNGVPVVATGSASVQTDADFSIVAVGDMTLRSAPGAGASDAGPGWPGNVGDVAPVRLRLTGQQPAVMIGMAAYELQRIGFAGVNALGIKAGTVLAVAPPGVEPWLILPTDLGADDRTFGWAVGSFQHERGLIEFRKPSMTGDSETLFTLPISAIGETP